MEPFQPLDSAYNNKGSSLVVPGKNVSKLPPKPLAHTTIVSFKGTRSFKSTSVSTKELSSATCRETFPLPEKFGKIDKRNSYSKCDKGLLYSFQLKACSKTTPSTIKLLNKGGQFGTTGSSGNDEQGSYKTGATSKRPIFKFYLFSKEERRGKHLIIHLKT